VHEKASHRSQKLATAAPLRKKNISFTNNNTISNKDDFIVLPENLVELKKNDINEEYEIDSDLTQLLGKGAFGHVKKGRHIKTGIVRAIKEIRKENFKKEQLEEIINEVGTLKTLDHPNILKVYEMYEDKKCVYIVTELCTGGELFEKIIQCGFLNEKKAAIILKQILSAIVYCHNYSIVHRDLKPENILYLNKSEDSQLKIIDFGTAKQKNIGKDNLHDTCGTVYYIAPEVLLGDYNEKCDV
jgi:calcium-dependent protein kinase